MSGQKEKRELYEVLFDVERRLLAIQAVLRTIKTPPDEVLAPHDGMRSLRPHTIPGWWQVWSGGLCIALLTPEDVEPIVDAEDARRRREENDE